MNDEIPARRPNAPRRVAQNGLHAISQSCLVSKHQPKCSNALFIDRYLQSVRNAQIAVGNAKKRIG
jgi:hypothetical protein